MAHGDAVGHGDGAEFARRAAGFLDALLRRLRLAHQGDVAGRGFVPAGGDADEGLVDLLLGQAHGVEIGAVRRPLRPLGHMAAGKFLLIKNTRVHLLNPGRLLSGMSPQATFSKARGSGHSKNPDTQALPVYDAAETKERISQLKRFQTSRWFMAEKRLSSCEPET